MATEATKDLPRAAARTRTLQESRVASHFLFPLRRR